MKLRRPRLGTWLKPTPLDDSPSYAAIVPASGPWANGSADDDDAAIHQLHRVLGGYGGGGETPEYVPSVVVLHGSHFRIGYQSYIGVQSYDTIHSAESDSTIGMPTRMRPPLIPRRNAGPGGVADAMLFVASQPNNWPVVQPTVSRR